MDIIMVGMRIPTNPRVRRMRRSPIHRRDKSTSYQRRTRAIPYHQGMSPGADTHGPRRAEFAAWLRAALAHIESERGWSVSRASRESGISRSQIYRWLDPEEAMPMPRKLTQFCDRLGLDFRQPARILGWSEGDAGTDIQAHEAKIRRANLLIESPDTPAVAREKYRALLRSSERILDDLFAEHERDQRRGA